MRLAVVVVLLSWGAHGSLLENQEDKVEHNASSLSSIEQELVQGLDDVPSHISNDGILEVTALPTPAPLASCGDGNHGCDTETTTCVVVGVGEGAMELLKAECKCLDGYLPSPQSLLKCVTSAEARGFEECDSIVEGCNPISEICRADPEPHCICADGFRNMSVNATWITQQAEDMLDIERQDAAQNPVGTLELLDLIEEMVSVFFARC